MDNKEKLLLTPLEAADVLSISPAHAVEHNTAAWRTPPDTNRPQHPLQLERATPLDRMPAGSRGADR